MPRSAERSYVAGLLLACSQGENDAQAIAADWLLGPRARLCGPLRKRACPIRIVGGATEHLAERGQQAILTATGYNPAAVELTATKVQFIVTLVNSKLVNEPASGRESEASRITAAIAGIIAEMPEFKGIQAIHVEYVSREPHGSVSRIIDGIDFRKDPQGNFQHHIT
jgi:hypothetical protein